MDLIICVLGLLTLIAEGVRCQGVYGECVNQMCDRDLVQTVATRNLFSITLQ